MKATGVERKGLQFRSHCGDKIYRFSVSWMLGGSRGEWRDGRKEEIKDDTQVCEGDWKNNGTINRNRRSGRVSVVCSRKKIMHLILEILNLNTAE